MKVRLKRDLVQHFRPTTNIRQCHLEPAVFTSIVMFSRSKANFDLVHLLPDWLFCNQDQQIFADCPSDSEDQSTFKSDLTHSSPRMIIVRVVDNK